MNSVYQINKGVNASMELKGLKAQYIGYMAALLLVAFILFAILFIAGVPVYICLILIGGTTGFGAFKIYALSHRYGPHGLQKLIARKRTPKFIKAYTRKIFY
ncbi:DUF4133 domain-containing protein [Mucilaginibacter ximonensis]|uniref:DUF4133 domain-containing protein n=1 Tax=Mucilaginibacter ximonensis TaxID=538021 RepID=A0ABW5Y994_9SPHI